MDFEKVYSQKNDLVAKEDFDKLYLEYKKMMRKNEKLNRQMNAVIRLGDKQFFHSVNALESNTKKYQKLKSRFGKIVRHSDRQTYTVMGEKTDLEIALEQELENERMLLREIEDTQKEVVYTMGAIGETRSMETGNHVKRVAEYSRYFAMHYGLSEDEVNILTKASPMHDIGKVAIADHILNKPGKLTDLEFEFMKEHAQIGYEMLKHSERPILKAASIVAHQHHEKWDGSGYPRGLKGEDIHIYGRITAIADVFDALGNPRVYKKAWSNEEIFELFQQEKGKHFDPKLVEIFFENLDDFLYIKEVFQDEPLHD